MSAPFAYTHPSNIASGYRTSAEYTKKQYPHPGSGEDYSHKQYPHPGSGEEYSHKQYPHPGSGEDYSHKQYPHQGTGEDYSHKQYPRPGSGEDYSHKQYPLAGGCEDYPLYHRDHCKLPRSNSNCCACVDDVQDAPAPARRADNTYRRIPSDNHNGNRTTHDIVAAYGVYSHGEQETGFEYPPQVVVVTSQRDGSTSNTLARDSTPEGGCCCPTVPLVLVVLFIIVFLLVSGVLFYFNIVTYAPESTLQDVCESVHCPHGGICMVDSAGKTVCRCPADCPSVLAPVCGADGRTYSNLCALRLYSCTNKKTILVQHTGECDSTDPCQSKVCPAGARCVPTPDGHSATCVCPKHCPKYSSHLALNPICGTDNHDYTDQCEMHRLACEEGRPVNVKYEGQCDPCAGQDCPPGEVCQLDEDRRAVCRCGESCADDPVPVCASDGHTYASECIMRLAACRSKSTLRIVYHGTCSSGTNPCSTVECSLGEECTITKYGIAQCECVSQCEPVVRQVCGSDGRTYDSECHLRKATCLDRASVTVLFHGPCGVDPGCSAVSCQYGGHCVVRAAEAVCECPRCPLHYDPICGSDGVPYNNPCELRAASCLQKKTVEVAHQGVCNGCETKSCGLFSTCEADENGVAQCICIKNCPKDEAPAPVCGSDGNTYASLCELKKFVCENESPVELDYEGDCAQCLEVQCLHGSRCRAGICVCPTDCPKALDEPVCASNMKTYSNECEMQKQSCATDPPEQLAVIFFGACNMKFKTGSINPTLVAHTMAAQTTSAPRDPCHDIQCDFDATCELGVDGFPRCSCLMDCTQAQEDVRYICGSDFRLYNSTCAMKMEACQRQKEIRLRPLDLCKGMEVKPCNGEGAVVDPGTGAELDCGSGPQRQDCPLDSYCHQTTHFAKCCPKEAGVYLKSCQDSWYGCCPDKKTPAQGPEHLGCPSLCGCNKIGSYSEACVGDTEQCRCKPGVGGLKCDRCEPGFWGLPKINSGYQGCLACDCSPLGSVREDCEQMTGRCVCKPGVQGHKCGTCSDTSLVLTENGCTSEVPTTAYSQCVDVSCNFGATCEQTQDGPQCICRLTCPEDDVKEMVCGDDGKLYASKCQLKLIVCQVQTQIGIQDMEYCSDDVISVTELTVKQWTLDDPLTDEEDFTTLRKKSRRHLHISESKHPQNSGKKESNQIRAFGSKHGVLDMKCALNPCNNGGVCHISATGLPICFCPKGFKGMFCTERLMPENELYYRKKILH